MEQKMLKILEKISKKAVGLFCVIVVTVMLLVYGKIKISSDEDYRNCFSIGNQISPILQSGEIYKQEFPIGNGEVDGVAIYFATYNSNVTEGKMNVSIFDQDGNLHFQESYDATGIRDNTYFNMKIKPIKAMGEVQVYNLCISFEGIENQTIAFYMTDQNKYDDYLLTINDEDSSCDLVIKEKINGSSDIFLWGYIIIGFVFVCVIICGYLMVYKFHAKIQKVYLVIGVCAEILYAVLIPIGVTPDESWHLYSAYSFSNGLFGIEDTSYGTVMMRADDVDAIQNMTYIGITREYYDVYFSKFKEVFVQNGDIVETSYVPVYAWAYLYMFSGLGIALGRVLHLGPMWVLMFGRVFNLAVFVWAVYYAIKKIPFGKTVLFIWALLPMTLQQTASYSYDMPILAMSVLIVSLSLKNIFAEEGERINKIEWIILLGCTFLLAPVKSMAIIPICALPLLILWKRRHEKKVWLSVLGTMVGILLVLVLNKLGALDKVSYVGNDEVVRTVETIQRGYGLGYLLHNPRELFLIILNTFFEKWDFYFNTFLGNSLGYFEINIPLWVVLPFFVMLIISGMKIKGEEQYLNKGVKMFLWLIVLLGYGFASAGMLMRWTPVGLKYVEGVQGRYLLPFAMLPFLAIRSDRAIVDKDVHDTMVFSTIWLEFLVFVCIYLRAL